MHHNTSAQPPSVEVTDTDPAPIYLDYNATTPVDPSVAHEMKPFLEAFFGNPSSSHAYGTKTKRAVEEVRTESGMK